MGKFAKDMAIDLGTAQTCVYLQNQGVVISEPSVVAFERDRRGFKKVLAVGTEAKRMLGKTPGTIVATRPIKDGVIADFDVTHAMLRYFISRIHKRKFGIRPRIVISVPSNITHVEKKAVKESANMAGAQRVFLVKEPMAAAIGAHLSVAEPMANMVVDIGGGTSEVAIISMAAIILSKSVRIGGDAMDETISNYIKSKYNLLIGQDYAERIKKEIGSACTGDYDREEMEVKGREMVEGKPAHIRVGAKEIRDALGYSIGSIVHTVRIALEQTPPELAADIIDRGIVLTGGGALLRGLSQLMSQEVSLPVAVADDPLYTVVTGAGKMLDNHKLLEQVALE